MLGYFESHLKQTANEEQRPQRQRSRNVFSQRTAWYVSETSCTAYQGQVISYLKLDIVTYHKRQVLFHFKQWFSMHRQICTKEIYQNANYTADA
jgi:hypothetical protein